MRKPLLIPYFLEAITKSHELLSLEPPVHPLLSIIDYHDIKVFAEVPNDLVIHDFYVIAIKKGFHGRIRYGQRYYDFNPGVVMSFLAPKQIVSPIKSHPESGWLIYLHPDYLRGHFLEQKIKKYAFFSYDSHEALHLNDDEGEQINLLIEQMTKEMVMNKKDEGREIILTFLDLMLQFANRFFKKQFFIQNQNEWDLLTRFEESINSYLENGSGLKSGLPTLVYLAGELGISPGYLSDMLKVITGRSALQHIHEHLIEKAKELLTNTNSTISEIAYQLGFSYPQSFSSFFKEKTGEPPLAFRRSFINKNN